MALYDFPTIRVGNATVFHGSNLDVLPFMADNSVDSIVTDPPYELGFMGKKWDSSGIAYSVELWRECLRVLKPGGHLLAFGGSRTWHRIAVAIEDAGFDVRDSIAWMYGSGFPKSMDVAKAIDKQSGFQGEVIGTETIDVGMQGGSMHAGRDTKLAEREIKTLSPTAEKWQGWGTALKPAFEPIVVARKPLIRTVAENILTWGVGGLNIDGSRISAEGENFDNLQGRPIQKLATRRDGETNEEYRSRVLESPGQQEALEKLKTLGRWPANVILDEYTAGLLDEQSGDVRSNGNLTNSRSGMQNAFVGGQLVKPVSSTMYHDKGGASRFFYVSKASKRDRNEGLDKLPDQVKLTQMRSANGTGDKNFDGGFTDTIQKNTHPTVKPTDLMRYLVKLVTPAGGIVLDPFTGSGSTGKAALLDGFRFIGIELTADYLPIIEGRLIWAKNQLEDLVTKREEEEKERLF